MHFTPGQFVWVLHSSNNEDIIDYDLREYMFLAEANNTAFLSEIGEGLVWLEDVLEYHINKTSWESRTEIVVVPIEDCFCSKKSAQSARQERIEMNEMADLLSADDVEW